MPVCVRMCFSLCFYLYFACVLITASQFSPHVFPKSGPYFEGWYMRIIDEEQAVSIGLLFGHVLPSHENTSTPPVVASVLFSRTCITCKLKSWNSFFNTSQVNLTVNGHPVSSNPDDISPAVFEWSLGENITFSVKGDTIQFAFYIGEVVFRGKVLSLVPWGPRGEGPEGWLGKLPLPLHWFVYSLHSHVASYEFAIPSQGKYYSGVSAVAHLEKNWGKAFPSAWIWAEGVDISTNVTLSLSGGLVNFQKLTLPAYLVGYRNPDKSLVLNFHPASDSVVTSEHDGCAGEVNITAWGLEYQVYIHIRSHPDAFSDCLFGAGVTGFQPACVENYNAVADVKVNRFGKTIDMQHIKNFALEFGGKYVCNNKCQYPYKLVTGSSL